MSLLRRSKKEDATSIPVETSLECPRQKDGTVMEKLTIEGVVIDRCPSCKGMWFDARELRRVSGDVELESLAARVREYARPSGFGCPKCGGECVQSIVMEVPVDTCRRCHGVWLDAGELDEAKREVQVGRTIQRADPGLRGFLSRL